MHSQDFGNDDAKSSDPLAIVAIIPEKVPHNGREQIVIVFNHGIPVKGRGQFMVDFVGTASALQVPAKQLNSSTLTVETPEYPSASVVTAHVYHGIHRRLLGQHTFEFLSRNDTFYRLLYGALDPVKFMCESLNISPAELQGLDDALAETFKTNAPEGFNLLGIHKDVVGDSTAEHPTLLHFASEFGLSRLTSRLLLFPGAQQACKIRNYHGQCPYEIAEAHGFNDLANTLGTFLDNQGDPDQIYLDMEHGEGEYYTRMQKDDGSYIYVPMDGESGQGLYVEMNGKRYINLNKDGEEEYLYMKKQSEDGSYHYVPMKGKAGDSCKIYDETTDRRICHQVQNQPDSDQYTSVDSEIYQNYQAGSASDGQEVYEDMTGDAEGQEPEDLYTCMDDSTNQMSNPEHIGYVTPTSNLPVHPDPAFYRSASNAADVRAKEIEIERKARSLPSSKGAMPSLDLLRTLQQDVADGNLTEEEVVAELMKKMGISGAATGPKRGSTSSSLEPRRGSTSSRSSTLTTSSSGSSSSGVSSGHEFPQHPQPDEYYDENEEQIHGNLQDLFPHLKQSGKICHDAPPPVPRPDYADKEERTAKSHSKRKEHAHARSRTTPVHREDIQAGLSSISTRPQVLNRRRSDPPTTESGLELQPKILPKTKVPQPSERPPAPIPGSESSPRPPKSPPAPAPVPRKMPPMGIPVFPEGPAPPTPQRVLPPSTSPREQPPPTPQRVPRAAPRGTSK